MEKKMEFDLLKLADKPSFTLVGGDKRTWINKDPGTNCCSSLTDLILNSVRCSQVKPTDASAVDMENLCQTIQSRPFDIPSHPRSLLDDLEVCIGRNNSVTSENVSITCTRNDNLDWTLAWKWRNREDTCVFNTHFWWGLRWTVIGAVSPRW